MFDIPIPKDPRHVKFADMVLDGVPAAKAYKQAGFKAKNAQTAAASSSRLLKNANIRQYMEAIQRQAADGKVLSLRAKREFLCRIVSTPLMSIDPRGPDGDLILKYKNTVTEGGRSEEIVKLDPLKAIELDNKLCGDDPEANAMASLAQALSGMAGGSGPVDDVM